jgi:hypothetical protein
VLDCRLLDPDRDRVSSSNLADPLERFRRHFQGVLVTGLAMLFILAIDFSVRTGANSV